ncbi:MAG: YaiI/YqxD family protein [Kangiellaceae bacterium]|nr:YaiI/YqxD family protein [Kangiellaceae bacterium]
MKIWVDADACPVVIKEILFKAAKRTGIETILVANHAISVPPYPSVRFKQVASGFDVADNEIVKRVAANDLVITSDIPLAAEVIDKGAVALSPRGELHTKENIKARLTMRDFMETMRASGIQSGGPAALNHQDRQKFANQLDRWLAQNLS